MAPLIILVCIISMVTSQAHATNDTCDLTYQQVGCFRGSKAGLILSITDRDHTSRNYSGKYLEWKSYTRDLRSLICRCDNKAKELGHRYFAIEYYAECWMVSNITLIRSSPASQGCVDVNLTTCGEDDKECAGKGFHQYVYKASEKWLSFPFADAAGFWIAIHDAKFALKTFPTQYVLKTNMTVNWKANAVTGPMIACSLENTDVVLAMSYSNSKLVIKSKVNDSSPIVYTAPKPFEQGKDIEVMMSQILRGGKYMYSIIINGVMVKEIEIRNARSFGATTCLVGYSKLSITLRNGVLKVRGD